MKTSQVFVNEKETYYPAIVAINAGKYGRYATINGINYSEKKITAMGYIVATLSEERISEIREIQVLSKKATQAANLERFMKNLTEINFEFKNGTKITGVGFFKENADNIGMRTQGSNAHEAFVMIDGVELLGRKHWSNDGIGIWSEFEGKFNIFVGEIHFIDDKVFLKKSE